MALVATLLRALFAFIGRLRLQMRRARRQREVIELQPPAYVGKGR